jgi:hypothetical protein
MNEDQVKEVIFAVFVFMQGGPPIDTQLGEWERAANEIYEIIAPTLSSGEQNNG